MLGNPSMDALRIAFDALVFVGAWVGMAWTVVIPVEAHVQSLPFGFDFSLFCLTFTFSLRAFIGLLPDELQLAQP